GRVLGDAQRIGERERYHRGADLDAPRERCEIAGIDENIGHDAVFVAEMMLGQPRDVEAELVGANDLARHPRMDVAMRIGLAVRVGVRRKQNPELHATALLDLPFRGRSWLFWRFKPRDPNGTHAALRARWTNVRGGPSVRTASRLSQLLRTASGRLASDLSRRLARLPVAVAR